MSKIVELRQDRRFIRANFEGYKLSLDAIPVLRQQLQLSPHRATQNDEQYSFLHTELFTLQNLLTFDPWIRTISYFVNSRDEIVRAAYNEKDGQPVPLETVYRYCLNGDGKRDKGDYNYSMRFLSEKYCLLCDGIRTITLLDTGDRQKSNQWKEVARANVMDKERQIMLFDCRLDIIKERKQISIALGRVEREEETKERGSSHFIRLFWAKWVAQDEWEFTIVEQLKGKSNGSVYYCAFEPRAESLVICSNRDFKFQSVDGTEVDESELTAVDENQQANGDIPDKPNYSWSQTDDEVVIKFDSTLDIKDKTDCSIKCTTRTLLVKLLGQVQLESTLFEAVDADLTTWTIENNFLQITLLKKSSSQWSTLFENGVGPSESVNENNNDNWLPEDNKPVANLEAPIEDCDFPMDEANDEIKIVRFHLATRSDTHIAMLGPNPPLFATNLRPGFPLAIATRQDVDACLWLQNFNPIKPDDWSLRHEGNLDALGYVQASKREKKFIDCAPDLSYSVISESNRHVFLYRSNNDSANGLHNRKGPQVSLGKQHLITLEDGDGVVLGLATANSVITILTEKCILYLQINQ